MDKYDTSQLTEFPRFESESSSSGVSTFLNKLWKFPLFAPSESADNGYNKSSEEEKQASARAEQQSNQYEEGKVETGSYPVELEGRSLPNVLRRISSLVALGSGGGTRYADTELARYWMPDDISRECYECASRFSTLRRRHHCRVCGQIFCSRCCCQRVPGHIFGCSGGLRVCNYCCNVVLSYLKENDHTGEISPDLKTLQESLQTKFPDNKDLTSKSRDNFVFAHDQDDRCDPRSSPKETLHDVFKQLSYALPTQQHRYRLVSYNGVWRGCDILQWVIDNTHYKTRAQASMICQSLLTTGYMECVTELPHFVDYALYRPIAMITRRDVDDDDEDDNNDQCEDRGRLVESVSSYCLDLNLGDKSARLTRTPKTEKKSSSSDEEAPVIEQNEVILEERPLCSGLSALGAEHMRLLLLERLSSGGLSSSWLPVLLPLCQRAANNITIDPLSHDIDIRNYVQVKKVPGGTPQDSTLINGVVLTKNVAHRGMPQEINKASILLLDCSIAYQRVEGKLTSLEPVLMQETEYLTRCAARITALRPAVVLVSGTAGSIVQTALRRVGSALAVRVRTRALRRAARCAAADMLASVDARIGTPRLGACEHFYVKNYGSKTLMVLEGCAEPQLGCCILLRGESLQELIRVKKVVKFMVLACYNWKLEKAFLADIDAILPEAGMTFDDDNDDKKNDESNDDVKRDDIFHKNDVNIVINDNDVKIKKEEKSDDENVQRDEINDLFSDSNSIKGDAKISDDNESQMKCEKIIEGFDKKAHKQAKQNSISSNEGSKSNTKCQEDDENTDDPLQRKYSRKTENLSCGVPIRDFSDPLRSTLSVEDEVFLPKEDTTFKADEHNERWSSDDMILSMSPLVSIPPPYLASEAGRRCTLRGCFPAPLVRARAPRRPPPAPRPCPSTAPRDAHEYHPFVNMAITSSADDPKLKASLASFRALGCRINTNKHKPSCPLYAPPPARPPPAEDTSEERVEPLDPYAPENHQKLHLLLYSFSSKSPNVPDFCVNPWTVTMEMYGRHDISLGAFLHKYCFNSEYKCTSNTCHIPMNQHVRRFVHGDVCITITCNTVGHSNVDKVKEEQSKEVMFWSRCEQCSCMSGGRRVSPASLALPLSAYLRGRTQARALPSRACAHAAHVAAHAFQAALTTACFRYSKISTYDIILPPDMISVNYDTKQMRDQLIGQLNELMLKGHETLSSIGDETDKEYAAFKHHMDTLHVALTAPDLHDLHTDVVQNLWTISDGIILGEKMLRDALDKSNPNKTKVTETQVEEKSDLDEYSTETENAGTTYAFPCDNTSKDSDKEHTGTEEDEEKGDKKTVRQILSQLLSNNQSANQQTSMIVCSGLVPVVVRATQTGAVIAAALASAVYRRATLYFNSGQPDLEESDSGSKEKADVDKAKSDKANKSNEHVEVLLKDGLMCRVYYAAQFQSLRHAVIAPRGKETECCCDDKKLCSIEEGFIRSLAQCVPWAARGGKSGSTFCKTKDDRYVLKEMTKPEWQQFLEFAPHYFNYMTTCRQNKAPSLLARILGVYSVGGAGSGVLVMEHVWYGSAARTRFDLKGSARHRLAPPHHVLMDENLLHLRWERSLYVRSHAGRALFGALERDTAFLATHMVMDYSLLLALGDNTLVLGLIDYIRTFTWDKKLEHLVKKNLGSGQPTVVSPEQYRIRFLTAARKYFLPCPEHWDHLYQLLPAMKES